MDCEWSQTDQCFSWPTEAGDGLAWIWNSSWPQLRPEASLLQLHLASPRVGFHVYFTFSKLRGEPRALFMWGKNSTTVRLISWQFWLLFFYFEVHFIKVARLVFKLPKIRGRPWTCDPTVSAFWVVGIIGLNQQTWMSQIIVSEQSLNFKEASFAKSFFSRSI